MYMVTHIIHDNILHNTHKGIYHLKIKKNLLNSAGALLCTVVHYERWHQLLCSSRARWCKKTVNLIFFFFLFFFLLQTLPLRFYSLQSFWDLLIVHSAQLDSRLILNYLSSLCSIFFENIYIYIFNTFNI